MKSCRALASVPGHSKSRAGPPPRAESDNRGTDGARGDPLRRLLLAEIAKRRPALEGVLRQHGDLVLTDYAKSLFARSEGQVSEVALEILREQVTRLFGREVADGTVEQLRACPSLNTGEHLSPLFHPRRLQSNLLAARGAAGQAFRYLPVLACTAISLANSSFPRGIFWDGKPIPMISHHAGSRSAFAFPALDRKSFWKLRESGKARAGAAHVQGALPEIDRLLDTGARFELWRRVQRSMLSGMDEGPLNLARALFLPEELQRRLAAALRVGASKGEEVATEIEAEVLGSLSPEIFRETRYASQICLLNAGLWSRAMLHAPWMPRLVYLPAEDFTLALLGDALSEGTALGRLLLDQDARLLALHLFEDLPGAWSSGEGTHFFWGLTPKGRMTPLRLQADELCGDGVRVKLSREGLLAAFGARRVVPGILLSLLSLHQHGFRCLGGPNQIHYAPGLCRRMGELCRSLRLTDGPDWNQAATGPTGDFLCGPLFWLRRGDDSDRWLPGSMDAFLRQPRQSLAEAEAAMQRLTLREATLLGLPDLYRTLVPPEERIAGLEDLDRGDF